MVHKLANVDQEQPQSRARTPYGHTLKLNTAAILDEFGIDELPGRYEQDKERVPDGRLELGSLFETT
jgi:hypothetical protein